MFVGLYVGITCVCGRSKYCVRTRNVINVGAMDNIIVEDLHGSRQELSLGCTPGCRSMRIPKKILQRHFGLSNDVVYSLSSLIGGRFEEVDLDAEVAPGSVLYISGLPKGG